MVRRAGRQGPPGDQVELAAQAEAGGRVEQGRHEREAGGDGADDRGAEQVARPRRRRRRAARRAGRTAAAPRAPAPGPAPAAARRAAGTARRRGRTAARRTPRRRTRPPGRRPARRSPVSRATASTAVVTHAAKRGPRTSTGGQCRTHTGVQGLSGRRSGHVWTNGVVLRESDRGSCRRGTGQLCGERSAGCPRRESSRSRRRSPDMGVHQGGQLVRAAARRCCGRSAAVAAEVEQRRGAPDVEFAHLVEVALGVDVDDREARAGGLQLLQPGLRGPAGRAERGGELDDGQVGVSGRTPRRSKRPAASATPSPAVRAPRRCGRAATRPRRAVTTSAATSTTAPDPAHPRPQPAGRRGGIPQPPRTVSVASTPDVHAVLGRRDAGELQAEGQRRHGVAQVEQVGGPRRPGSRGRRRRRPPPPPRRRPGRCPSRVTVPAAVSGTSARAPRRSW